MTEAQKHISKEALEEFRREIGRLTREYGERIDVLLQKAREERMAKIKAEMETQNQTQ